MAEPTTLYSKTGGPALRRLHRTIADLAHPFAAWLAEESGIADLDPQIAREVAEAEAEGATLIGALPCPDALPHGHGREQEYAFSDACPSCGAAL